MPSALWSATGPYITIALTLIAIILIVWFLIRTSCCLVYVKSDEFAVVNRIYSFRRGSPVFMSLDRQPGYQPDVLRTGLHWFFPFMNRVYKQKLITVRGIAYVYSRIGKPLPPGQILAYTPPNITFESVRDFLNSNGERGPQRTIIREGIYALNTAAFVIFTEDGIHTLDIGQDKATIDGIAATLAEREAFKSVTVQEGTNSLGKPIDLVGVVTVHDGPALPAGEIIAQRVGSDDPSDPHFHNSFQNPQAFLDAGGHRGRQDQVITEGTFVINKLFATIEYVEKTIVKVGEVGVIISYTGTVGEDLSGDDYKHGRLVGEGHRGVLEKPYDPGKYAISPYSRKVEPVPTTNFVLRWMQERTEDHGFDSGLSEIPLITKDAFQPMLPLSVVVHIAPDKASRVIQQFASIKLLVDQTLDPIVSAFFKDAAQETTMLQLISQRTQLQKDALTQMRARFLEYHLDLQEVMIGTPRAMPNDTAIPRLLDQLRERQTAFEQKETYKAQEMAQAALQALNTAKSLAEMQTQLTNSQVEIEIAQKRGQARAKEREGEAQGILAIGNANADVIAKTGRSEAEAIKAKVDAFQGEGAERQLQQAIAEIISNAIVNSKNPVVPGVMVGADRGTGGGNLVEALLALALPKQA